MLQQFSPSKFIFALSISLISASPANAGGRDGGGGVVFLCNEGNASNIYLADLYPLLKSGKEIVVPNPDGHVASENEALEAITESIGKVDPDLASRLKNNLQDLTFQPVASVPLLGDDDITRIPAGCTKAQLAIQYFARNVVEYNQSYFELMSGIQKALFKLHEAYVKVYRFNSSTVRRKVAREASSQSFSELFRASVTVAKDRHSAALAKALSGRAIRCSTEAPSTLFPATIRATDLGQGKTILSIETKDGGSFSASGEYLSVKYSKSQMMLSDGDDGWNVLSIQLKPERLDLGASMPATFYFLGDGGYKGDITTLECSLTSHTPH